MRTEGAIGQVSRPSMLTLARVFLGLGATTFGGPGAALVLIERELVTERRLLTRAQLVEALIYTRLLPGPTVVEMVAYVAYKLGGWPGSALATVVFLIPAFLTMVLVAVLYGAATATPNVGPAVDGLMAGAVGVLLAATWRLGRANIHEPLTLGIAVVAFAAGAFLDVNAALIVIVAGLIGVLLLSQPEPEDRRLEERSR